MDRGGRRPRSGNLLSPARRHLIGGEMRSRELEIEIERVRREIQQIEIELIKKRSYLEGLIDGAALSKPKEEER